MAKAKRKTKTRAKSPAQIVATINGHQLDKALYDRYISHFQSRAQANRDATVEKKVEFAIEDTTYPHRPSKRSGDILHGVHTELMTCLHAVGLVSRWPWHQDGFIKSTALDLLQKTAEKASNLSKVIEAYRNAVSLEDSQHVQEWVKLDSALAGCVKVPHGN